MKVGIGLVIGGVAALLSTGFGEEKTGGFLDYVRARAAAMRAGDAAPGTLAAWERQKATLRARLEAAWGGFPDETCALEPRVVGVIERDGYRVEKVVLQTMEGVWMTANAYVPDVEGKVPAVLCVHGHWRLAKQEPTVQARCIGLAKLGYFVLAVDAIGAGERGIGKALGEYHGEMVAATLIPSGRVLCGLQVYENTRAIDYLQSRPEVDGARIGVTGASGGGNQTMYIAAWDERVTAAVPTCSVGNYQAYLGAACCMCEVVPGALSFTEESGVLAMVAPRALMVSNATRDSVQFSVEEAAKSVAGARPVFELYGAGAKLKQAVFESKHDYNREMREAMYGWMALHLKGEGDGSPVAEPAMETEDPEALRCFPGETRPDDFVTLPQLAARFGREALAGLAAEEREHLVLDNRWNQPRSRLNRLFPGMFPPGGVRSERMRRHGGGSWVRTPVERDDGGGGVEWEGTIEYGNPSGEAPVRARFRVAKRDLNRIVVIVDPEGAVAALGGELGSRLGAAGVTVVGTGLRATGEMAPERDKIGRAPDHNSAEWSLWLGEPLIEQWVWDVRMLLGFLDARFLIGGRNETAPQEIVLVGRGVGGTVATIVAALDRRVDAVVSDGALASYVSEVPYEGQRLGLMVPGILRQVGDLSAVAGLVAPRPVLVSGGVDGGGEQLTAAEMEALGWSGDGVEVRDAIEDEALAAWILERL